MTNGVTLNLFCCSKMAAIVSLSAESLKEKLTRELDAEHVEVDDTSANRCATSFKVLVVSSKFEGKPLLQRHRLVNSCLSEEMKDIHAFEQKTLTPQQWEKEKQK
ncbi:bolA-like protein 2 [Ambystoma mexicanum]|uniref:bolA-like protein 2 n=1 Tax=Ambystoma mexicanum TaxID=8296 RepID=UPI0037E88F47